jgi:hypothetical protein
MVKGTRAHAPEWSMNGGPDRVSDAAFLVAGIRRIEVAEGLLLQGFPADWPLQGTGEERYREVRDAVPPTLAYVAAHQVVATRRAVAGPVARGLDMTALTAALLRQVA